MASERTTVTSVSVGTTPTELVAADSRIQWRVVELWPGDAKTAYLGDEDVTTTTGIPITSDGNRPVRLEVGRNGIWGITATGTATVTVRSRFLDLG